MDNTSYAPLLALDSSLSESVAAGFIHEDTAQNILKEACESAGVSLSFYLDWANENGWVINSFLL